MAAMRPFQSLSFLSLAPLYISACRVPSVFSQQSQCTQFSTSASSESFSFRIAASFSAKGHRFNPKKDLFSFNQSQSILGGAAPHKRPNSGQDAFFVSSIGNSANVVFGVADGVGGWIESGIDSADFSHGLCESMTEIARKEENPAERKLRAGKLLQEGYDAVVADQSIIGGGSTACIAVGNDDGTLEVANLGDSGFVQFRPNAVQYSSNPQTHAFNTPYQLSIIPPQMLAKSRIFGGEPLRDSPRDANITHHKVKHGDVLIFATDGVWDNLNSADLLTLVSRNMIGFNGWESGKDSVKASDRLQVLTTAGGIPKQFENSLQTLLAVAITGEAKMASLNTKVDGPFAREVHKYYPREEFHGGKADDICVVVAVVVRNDG